MKDIKGTTRVCGLVGNPVEHSISPLIHNTLAEIENIDMAYVTFRCDKGMVETGVKGAHALNVLGMNVTVPYKQEVLASLDGIDELAAAIGAVNTLVRTEKGYKGYNTDILGLKRELAECGIELAGNDVILLGAGGAARAIAFLCASEKAASVSILNRTVEKAEDIAQAVKKALSYEEIAAYSIEDYAKLAGKEYIIIQTTSVGLAPNVEDVVIGDDAFYDMAKAGVDIIYNPSVTMFMKKIMEKGKPAYNGLKMLLYQGVAAFELWNQVQVSEEEAAVVYERMKREMNIIE